MQDLLNASLGLNLGIDFLPGAFRVRRRRFGGRRRRPPAAVAGRVLRNVDRTWRNPDLLLWHGDLSAIDHGAYLYLPHGSEGGVTDPARFAAMPWTPPDMCCSTPCRPSRIDATLRESLNRGMLAEASALVPDKWLDPCPARRPGVRCGRRTSSFLDARLASTAWLPEAA